MFLFLYINKCIGNLIYAFIILLIKLVFKYVKYIKQQLIKK